MTNIVDCKKDFPIFKQNYEGNALVYLDSAATSQKPHSVIDSQVEYYSRYNANVSRGSNFLADLATQKFDQARNTIAKFINAKPNELIFTKNSTEALNMIAFGWGLQNLSASDVILTTIEEHNSSVLPFRNVATLTNAKVEYIDILYDGTLVPEWEKKITQNVKLIVLTHISNVLGTILPIKELVKKAHEVGAVVVVDGSQAVSHIPVDMLDLACDFYVFSGHKMLGPTGIGVLYGKASCLENMSPMFLGGGTVKDVDDTSYELRPIPERFEAGTPNIAGAIGLGVAVDYINALGISNIQKHDQMLCTYAFEKLSAIADIKILGTTNVSKRSSLLSFYVDNVHSHDISSILSTHGVVVRSGLHCAMQLYKKLDVPSSTRISFHVYNTKEDIDVFINALKKALEILQKK